MSAALVGLKGLVGALIGVAAVTVFFAISIAVVGRAAKISPAAMMVAALVTFLVKIVALAVVVSAVTGTTAFSTRPSVSPRSAASSPGAPRRSSRR